MVLSKDHVKNVCRFGKPNGCCFLTLGAAGPECAKGTEIEAVIRSRLAHGSMRSTSDNCSGPPNFKPPVESN